MVSENKKRLVGGVREQNKQAKKLMDSVREQRIMGGVR